MQRPVSPADEKGNKDQFGQSKQDDGGGGNAVIGLDGFAVFVGRFGRFIEYGQAKACEIRGALARRVSSSLNQAREAAAKDWEDWVIMDVGVCTRAGFPASSLHRPLRHTGLRRCY